MERSYLSGAQISTRPLGYGLGPIAAHLVPRSAGERWLLVDQVAHFPTVADEVA
jgi:hypothetical protein